MEVNQLLVGAGPGDAITSMALQARTLLRQHGPSEVYAFHIHPDVVDDVRPMSAYPSSPSLTRTLIYHSSIGQPEVTKFLLASTDRLIVDYHNITPYELLLEVDPTFASLLAWGRTELALLRDRASLAVADSAFNENELRELGYTDVTVLPLGFRPGRLLDEEDDPATGRWLDAIEEPIVLSVGQLLPHKRVELVVEAVHIANTHLRLGTCLVLAGRVTTAAYGRGIRGLVDRLYLPGARLTGALTDRQLATCFRRAAVYVIASDHEGFGIPPVEAMAFGVPVIARGCAALPDTIGGAGIVLDPSAGPTHLAEAIAAVVGSPTLSAQLASAGQARAAELSVEAAEFDFVRRVVGAT